MDNEITQDPELIGLDIVGEHWHECPLCGGGLFWSGKHDKFGCIRCGYLFDMDDIMAYEKEVI